MRILGAKRVKVPPSTVYATAADFCQLFADDMNRLYLLSLLLTADQELAERCFVGGLETSRGGNPVFKEWAQSWARRAIITNAIRMMRPRPRNRVSAPAPDPVVRAVEGLPPEFTAIMGLEVFERFVFVMSVLEGYSLRESKLLLDCSSSEVAQARIRAFEQLGTFGERQGKAEKLIRLQCEMDSRELMAPQAVPRLAVPA